MSGKEHRKELNMDKNLYFLSDLNAVNKGNYYIVNCPNCGHHEAFIYLDDIQKGLKDENYPIPIRCNRLSKCGKVSVIRLKDYQCETDKVWKEIPQTPQEKDILKMSPAAVHRIQQLCMYEAQNSTNQPDSWRGISKEVLKKYHIIFLRREPEPLETYPLEIQNLVNDVTRPQYVFGDGLPKGILSFIEKAPSDCEYSPKLKRELYNRDILIPIEDYDGTPVRVLLRNTKPIPAIEGKKTLKEITLLLSVNSSEIWNRKDLIDPKFSQIFITEGVPDALSIKELNPEVGVVALPGVAKFRQILREIEVHPEIRKKELVLCFDNDKAGIKWKNKFIDELTRISMPYKYLQLNTYKDVNEYLEQDREGLQKEIEKAIHGRTRRRFYFEKKKEGRKLDDNSNSTTENQRKTRSFSFQRHEDVQQSRRFKKVVGQTT